MFDIGWSELLVIVIVAIVVVGPKELPRLMRTFGIYAGKFRRAAADFQHQFEAAMAESEADAVRKNIENIRQGFDQKVMLPKPELAGPPPAPVSPPAVAPEQTPPPDAPKPVTADTPAKPAEKPVPPRPEPAPKRVPAKAAVSSPAKPAPARRKAQTNSQPKAKTKPKTKARP